MSDAVVIRRYTCEGCGYRVYASKHPDRCQNCDHPVFGGTLVGALLDTED